MNTYSRISLGFVLALFMAGEAGAANHKQEDTVASRKQEDTVASRKQEDTVASKKQEDTVAARMGADFQRAGIMSQSDYVRIRSIGHAVGKTHTISDSDLNFTLTLIPKSNSSLARARSITILFEINPMSAEQKARITPVIKPYLSSKDPLDSIGVARVQAAMDGRHWTRADSDRWEASFYHVPMGKYPAK